MIRATQRHQPVLGRAAQLPSMRARELQRTFHRLRSAGRKEDPRHARKLAQLLRQQARPRVRVLRRKMHHLRSPDPPSPHHPRMRVPQRVHAQAAHHIQVAVPVHVKQQAAFAALHHHRIACVHRDQVLLISRQHISLAAASGAQKVPYLQFTSALHIGQAI